MDREGSVVLREEQVRRLLVAYGTAQQHRAVLVAIGLHAVDALVQRLGVDALEVPVQVRVVRHPVYLGGRPPSIKIETALGPAVDLWVPIGASVPKTADSETS